MFRIGHGYDVHRLVEKRKLTLCGQNIKYAKGLLGHSDADVATHALIDAICGAASFGDIGRLFPDTDEKYRGISSLKLLEVVEKKLENSKYKISNIDLTIIAQSPKLSKYIDYMKNNISKVLKIENNQINIKATTEEGLGYTGSNEGIAAHCVVLIYNS